MHSDDFKAVTLKFLYIDTMANDNSDGMSILPDIPNIRIYFPNKY